jgi:hypothetical protein
MVATMEKLELFSIPDTVQFPAHISSSKSPNAPILVLLESWDNFPELS